MSASPDNPTASPAPVPKRLGHWRGWWPLVLGVLIGAASMFFFRQLAQPPAVPSAANSSPADENPFQAATARSIPRGDQPTLATSSVAGGQATDDADPFVDMAARIEPDPAERELPFAPVPMDELNSAASIKVNPLDDEVAAAARLTHAAQTASELRRLTEAQRDAQAELAAELAAHVDDPPSALFDQLDALEQLLDASLAETELLTDRIQTHQDQIARLDERSEKLAADKRAHKLDQLIVRAFEAQARLALAKEKHRGERSPEEISILAEEVRDLDKLYRKVTALYLVGAKGGEHERWTLAGYHLCRARADLELASGDRPAALVEMRKVREFVEAGAGAFACFGDCEDMSRSWADYVSRRTTSYIRLYELARLLGDKPLIDWARKMDGG